MILPAPFLSNALVELFLKGGPIMWPIALLTLFSVAVIVERVWWWFLLSRNRNAALLDTVLTALEAGNVADALKLCGGSEDPVLRVISAGITHRHASLQGALQAAAGVEIKRAGRFLTAMDTIITLAPLLGLLGTVTGIMGSFSSIGSSELAVEKVTGGIGEALIATAFGLGIAIVTLVPYNWFHSLVASLQHDIETAANNVEVFTAQKK
jgi:biopolymer transport protein ExbB